MAFNTQHHTIGVQLKFSSHPFNPYFTVRGETTRLCQESTLDNPYMFQNAFDINFWVVQKLCFGEGGRKSYWTPCISLNYQSSVQKTLTALIGASGMRMTEK